jgi:hypothetical protein
VTLKLPLVPSGVTDAGANDQLSGPPVFVIEIATPVELAKFTTIVFGPLLLYVIGDATEIEHGGGTGVGVGVTVGVGVGDGLGVGVTLGCGVGVALGSGDGVTLGSGVIVGDGAGVGVAGGSGFGGTITTGTIPVPISESSSFISVVPSTSSTDGIPKAGTPEFPGSRFTVPDGVTRTIFEFAAVRPPAHVPLHTRNTGATAALFAPRAIGSPRVLNTTDAGMFADEGPVRYWIVIFSVEKSVMSGSTFSSFPSLLRSVAVVNVVFATLTNA